jgi:hypothetical protein
METKDNFHFIVVGMVVAVSSIKVSSAEDKVFVLVCHTFRWKWLS